MTVVFFLGIMLIGALIHLAVTKEPRTTERVLSVFLLWALIVTGLQGVLAFVGHVFFGPAVAKSIGWPPNNPFQFEVGIANLSLGFLGLACIWRRDFWLPTIVMATVFYWGAAYGHIDQIIRFQNYAPNNAGAALYSDIITPLILIGLYTVASILHGRSEKSRPAELRRAA